MKIYYIIGYIVIGTIFGYLADRGLNENEKFGIPTIVCCTLFWPLFLMLLILVFPFWFLSRLEKRARIKNKGRDYK